MMIISAAFLGKNPFGFRKFSENDWKVHVVPKAWKILQLICGPELLNVSIRRIRLNSHILLNKKNRRKFNL